MAKPYDPSQNIGKKFGTLTLLSFKRVKKILHYYCKCDCGKTKLIQWGNIQSGGNKSCGCLLRAWGNYRTKHKLYRTWYSMISRCYIKNSQVYKYYGGKGVKVCDRWRKSFWDFVKDMGEKPSRNHSIDRIDVSGNYEPTNCRWANRFQQANNRTNNKLAIIDGECKTAAEWARELNVPSTTFIYRNKEILFRRG